MSEDTSEEERAGLVERRARLVAIYQAATERGQWKRAGTIEVLLYEVDGRLADLLRAERRQRERRRT